jgi:biopolymer transport protein ExbD/biopolymer transport protein TolR
MRRFSQRNSLVTLSDINITPLLDLAFVLLIIFVITTPLLTQSLEVNLPAGGQKEKKPLDARLVKTVEITKDGEYRYEKKAMNPEQIETELVKSYKANTNLVVAIRTDREGPSKYFFEILDRCKKHGITRISFRTEPVKHR